MRGSMLNVMGGVLVALSVIPATAGAQALPASAGAKIAPPLERALSAAPAGEPVRAWVFFAGRGDVAARLAEAEASLTQKARVRRVRCRGEGNLVDARDLPVLPGSHLSRLVGDDAVAVDEVPGGVDVEVRE